MEFHIGARIHDRDDNDLGKLGHVIVDPATDEVVELVLTEGGLLGRDVLVPVESVRSADPDVVHLELDKEQAGRLKDFVITHYTPPDAGAYAGAPWAGGALVAPGMVPVGAAAGIEPLGFTPIVDTESQIPEGDVDIESGSEVWATDGKVGVVSEVVVDPQTRRIESIVVEHGLLFQTNVAIPRERIADLGAGRITLNVSKSELTGES